jgi:hypothetical protein
MEYRKLVSGHICEGYTTSTTEGTEFDCEYEPDFPCDECVFVVGQYSDDYRKGKRPWAKKWGGQP